MSIIQPLSVCEDPALAGGKAANLGRLLRSGFSVPDGFVVTTQAAGNGTLTGGVRDEVLEAWRTLKADAVAVRSSAPFEDGAQTSAAGQYDSFLNITDEDRLLGAISQCRESFHNPRAHAYRMARGSGAESGAMAVIVQRLVPADVSGVLFTCDPQNADAMRVEATRGTGEELVSGRVRPEVWRIDRDTGDVTSLADGDFEVPCLDAADLRELWRIGCAVAGTFGAPQDIEWATCNGEFFILQTRPITVDDSPSQRAARIESLRSELRDALASGHGPWALHTLSESLGAPTELTWSVMERFLSGAGGFGRLYELAGFPVSSVGTVARRIGGGIYSDLAAAPGLFGLPLRYDPDAVRQNPAAAHALPTVPTGGIFGRARARFLLNASRRRLRGLAAGLDTRLIENVIPHFTEWCRGERTRDLASLSAEQWLATWRERERRTFDEFAPQALLATLVSAIVLGELRAFVVRHAWDEDVEALIQSFSADADPFSPLADLRRLVRGEWREAQWLDRWGHRGPDEMELASPRWNEQPGRVREMATAVGDGPVPAAANDGAAFRARLTSRELQELDRLSDLARRYTRFREIGRHWITLGCNLLRELALEAGRRLGIGDGIFQLTPPEIAESLRSGSAPRELIARRDMQRSLDRRIFLPPLIDADAVESLGELPPASPGGEFQGSGVSAGTAVGTVRIVDASMDASSPASRCEPGEILVCTTLDPNLTPLFLRAGGLVVECGGALSHAAIVAREMRLPAVVLPGATALLTTGMKVALDGSNGTVRHLDRADVSQCASFEPPPPPSRRERASVRTACMAVALWSLGLLAAFTFPREWVLERCMAVLDRTLWPLATALGKPGAVAVIATLLAVAVALVQRLLADNSILLASKKRARELSGIAPTLPEGASRRRAGRFTTGVQLRLLASSCVAPAILLGPLALTLLWLSHRMDPAKVNPPPGSDFAVIATVMSDSRNAVRIDVPPPLRLDPVTPPTQTASPIRETLERLLTTLEAQAPPPREKIADLRAYLSRGVPPQKLMWKVSAADVAVEGVFPMTLRLNGAAPVTIRAAFGERIPPAETSFTGTGDVQTVELIRERPSPTPRFWAPLSWAGVAWDAGWLGLYLAAYLGTTAISRRLLKLP